MHPMNASLRSLLGEATRLTRSGDLQAATLAIQRALGGAVAPSPPSSDDAVGVIDVEAREVPDSTPERTIERRGDPSPPAAPPASRHAGEFIGGRYADAHGTRNYKLYVPACYTGQPLPLVVMLHGCTQNPDDFAAGTGMNAEAATRGFFALYPEQSQKANASRCWNWFKHNHQQRGRGEPALLAGMTQQVMLRFAVDRQRVYVAGLSAGGAMAAILGDMYPELYAAVGVHSGLARGSAADMPGAFAAMKGGQGEASATARIYPHCAPRAASAHAAPPTIVFHGDDDRTVHSSNGDAVIAACTRAARHEAAESGRAPGGRSYTRRSYRDAGGRLLAEYWIVHGAGHAWSGGSALGSYTDAKGPAATQEMSRFFLAHTLAVGR